MEIVDFVPNWKRNAGRSFAKDGDKNRVQEKPTTKKKRTSIPGAITSADEVEEAVQQAIAKKRGTRKDTKAKGRKMSKVPTVAGLPGTRQASRKASKPGRKRQRK